MATEIKAPVFPESVADGTIATWHKKLVNLYHVMK
jgi:2-oxoglutarate dehydrogenase E2 component (dihydrolipoamide succinyltransferase)